MKMDTHENALTKHTKNDATLALDCKYFLVNRNKEKIEPLLRSSPRTRWVKFKER